MRADGHAVDPYQLCNLYPSASVTNLTIGAHFLSSYRADWNSLLHQPLQDTDAIPEDVKFHQLKSLSPLALAANQVKRKLQNTFAS